jgi:PDZ domain-containing protein
VKKESQVAFTDSQSEAVAAALHHLKIPVTEVVVVSSVEPGAPADGKLEVGDVMVAVDGEVVHTATDVGRIVRSKPVGTAVPMTVRRSGVTTQVTVVTGPKPSAPKTSFLGIATTTTYRGPFPITFGLDDVGGPSAGTMFALGIVDKLTPGELNGGRFVAGTGTIDAAGQVGPIGGIAQKMEGARRAGATLFLAPKDNCGDVVGHVPDGLTVTPMSTLDEAVSRVEGYVAGKALPSCPAG